MYHRPIQIPERLPIRPSFSLPNMDSDLFKGSSLFESGSGGNSGWPQMLYPLQSLTQPSSQQGTKSPQSQRRTKDSVVFVKSPTAQQPRRKILKSPSPPPQLSPKSRGKSPSPLRKSPPKHAKSPIRRLTTAGKR